MSFRFWLCLSVLTLSVEISAQPYLYYKNSYYDTGYGESLDIIYRYDLFTKTTEEFPPDQILSNYAVPVLDQTASYLDLYINKVGNFIYNCSDTSVYYEWDVPPGTEIEEMLYSSRLNKLFIFLKDYLYNPSAHLSVFDLSIGKIINSVSITNYVGFNSLSIPTRNSFFSSDESKIYFYSSDTSNNNDQVWTYSIEKNMITEKRNLASMGYKDMDGYNLNFGRNGKGVINSFSAYNNSVRDFYYRLYDFDTDSGYAFIYNGTYADPYLSGGGNYLILSDVDLDSSYLYYTGTVKIFNSQNGVLIKNISFPPGGRVYTFDNYPDDLYYVINIDSPKRQIFRINADSLLNKRGIK